MRGRLLYRGPVAAPRLCSALVPVPRVRAESSAALVGTNWLGTLGGCSAEPGASTTTVEAQPARANATSARRKGGSKARIAPSTTARRGAPALSGRARGLRGGMTGATVPGGPR